MSVVLEIENLQCGYGSVEVLHGVSLEVRTGEIVCLIGPNGAGKSTLTRAAAGIIPVRKGAVRLHGRDVTRDGAHSRVRQGLALVPEGRGVLAQLSVLDNILMGAYVRRKEPGIQKEIDSVLQLFPVLAARKDQAAGTLSGGEQQMLVIGRALMSKPQLMILDEPSLGLAPKMVALIFEVLDGLRRNGSTILLIEQNAHMALSISSRGYVLESGDFVLSGDTSFLRENDLVKDIYLGSG
jgi:branched-chain amino acid transport system ATP-binding protein